MTTKEIYLDLPFDGVVICTECGCEYEAGINARIEHFKNCKGDAPNCNMHTHYHFVAVGEFIEARIKRFKPIRDKMTDDEKFEHSILGLLPYANLQLKFEAEMEAKYG